MFFFKSLQLSKPDEEPCINNISPCHLSSFVPFLLLFFQPFFLRGIAASFWNTSLFSPSVRIPTDLGAFDHVCSFCHSHAFSWPFCSSDLMDTFLLYHVLLCFSSSISLLSFLFYFLHPFHRGTIVK